MPESLSLGAVIVLALTAAFLLINQNWRWGVIALSVQYLAVFLLVLQEWSLGLAAIKLITGWMAGTIIGISHSAAEQDERPPYSAQIFRLLAAGMVGLLAWATAPLLASFLPVKLIICQGAIILVGMGLLQLGMYTRPLRVAIGLLTALSGFELLYAGLESSILVVGLLAGIDLGLAWVAAYLVTMNPAMLDQPRQP